MGFLLFNCSYCYIKSDGNHNERDVDAVILCGPCRVGKIICWACPFGFAATNVILYPLGILHCTQVCCKKDGKTK
jgi:hypothetical protein